MDAAAAAMDVAAAGTSQEPITGKRPREEAGQAAQAEAGEPRQGLRWTLLTTCPVEVSPGLGTKEAEQASMRRCARTAGLDCTAVVGPFARGTDVSPLSVYYGVCGQHVDCQYRLMGERAAGSDTFDLYGSGVHSRAAAPQGAETLGASAPALAALPLRTSPLPEPRSAEQAPGALVPAPATRPYGNAPLPEPHSADQAPGALAPAPATRPYGNALIPEPHPADQVPGALAPAPATRPYRNVLLPDSAAAPAPQGQAAAGGEPGQWQPEPRQMHRTPRAANPPVRPGRQSAAELRAQAARLLAQAEQQEEEQGRAANSDSESPGSLLAPSSTALPAQTATASAGAAVRWAGQPRETGRLQWTLLTSSQVTFPDGIPTGPLERLAIRRACLAVGQDCKGFAGPFERAGGRTVFYASCRLHRYCKYRFMAERLPDSMRLDVYGAGVHSDAPHGAEWACAVGPGQALAAQPQAQALVAQPSAQTHVTQPQALVVPQQSGPAAQDAASQEPAFSRLAAAVATPPTLRAPDLFQDGRLSAAGLQAAQAELQQLQKMQKQLQELQAVQAAQAAQAVKALQDATAAHAAAQAAAQAAHAAKPPPVQALPLPLGN